MDEKVRAVNVNEVIKQRSSDILQAFQAFKNGRSTRTPMQRLPRHMRRRAMSHNVKRMPRNWRQYAAQATKKSKHRKKPPSRYYRRRRRFQGGAPDILRTHVWHAKRYHMKKIVGGDFTLPFKRFQKVQRVCIRAAAKGCCVADHSYWKSYKIPITAENEKSLVQFIMDYCRLQKPPTFEYNKCHDLVLYNSKKDQRTQRDCIGPIQIRRIETENEKYFEFAVDIRSDLSSFLQESKILFELLSQARITLYGPKALEKVIEALNVTKTEEENPFNDVLDGALLLKGYWFKLKVSLSREKELSFDLIYRNQAPETVIDVVFDQTFQKEVWIKLVHRQCQPLGITDEQNLRTFYGKFSFPDDCPDFMNPLVLGFESKELQNKHFRKPTNRRVKYEALSPDNPFNFDFDKIAKSETDLVPVKIVPIGKGAPKRYAFIYSQVQEEVKKEDEDMNETEEGEELEEEPPKKKLALDEDFIPLSTGFTSKYTKIVPMSRLFETETKKKLSRGMKRRARKKAKKEAAALDQENMDDDKEDEKEEEFLIPQGTVIGRIVRGLRWSSKHGNMLGLGYCSSTALESIIKTGTSIVFFRNPASKKYRRARITIIRPESRFY